MKFDNQWGTICDDSWGLSNAVVTCRQLGYTTGTALTEAAFGAGSGPIWQWAVACVGSEKRLQDCVLHEWGTHDLYCDHQEDAAVKCSNKGNTFNYWGLSKGISLKKVK